MSTRQTIAVDIDDVLAAHAEGFIAYGNKQWGTKLTVDDYDEHFSSMWQTDHAETQRRAQEFHESGTFGTFRHFETAKEVLARLSQRYELVVITSRRRIVADETLKWIDTYFKGTFSEVRFAGMWDTITENSLHMTKNDMCRELGASFLIDDQLKHCFAAAEAGLTALLFGDYAWNATVVTEALPQNVVRVKDWHAVQAYFDDKS